MEHVHVAVGVDRPRLGSVTVRRHATDRLERERIDEIELITALLGDEDGLVRSAIEDFSRQQCCQETARTRMAGL